MEIQPPPAQPLAVAPAPIAFKPFIPERPPVIASADEGRKVQTHKICKECNTQKSLRSFSKVDGERRRNVCNRCARAKREAKKLGMTKEDYLAFSDGPCQFCGQGDTKAYFHQRADGAVFRVCGTHRTMFRTFDKLDQLTMLDGIMRKFPFWMDFLKTHNLSLFTVDVAFE